MIDHRDITHEMTNDNSEQEEIRTRESVVRRMRGYRIEDRAKDERIEEMK